MDEFEDDYPHRIACFRAVEAYCGGRAVLSEILGITPNTINYWLRRGKIPHEWIKLLTKRGKITGLKLTADDFVGVNDEKFSKTIAVAVRRNRNRQIAKRNQ